MSLVLSRAHTTDAARIAEIHMAAFGQNEMLLAQFPTPAVRESLQQSIEDKAVADILDPKQSVLVVRDEISNQTTDKHSPRSNGFVIAFAKWTHPVAKEENYTEPVWIWPAGTNLEVLEAWTRRVEEAEKKVLGDSPFYRLSFMGTDPRHQKRGAATLMIEWGLEQCKRECVPAYLESTMGAVPLYEKHGFTAAAEISLRIEGKGGSTLDIYKELACIFRPQSTPSIEPVN